MPQTYTIVAGDTLSAIAQRYNLTLDQLLALNPTLTRESVIDIGQVINVAGTPPTPGANRDASPDGDAAALADAAPHRTPAATAPVTATTAVTPTAPTSTPASVAHEFRPVSASV